jgi:superfamily I DNA and RNA helicase
MTDLGISADDYWTHHVPQALFDAAAKLPEAKRYDAVIVDEGQDFKSTYWEPVQMLLKDPDGGILYIFYDDCQRLYSEDSFPLPEPAGRLNKNMRSTYEIGERVVEYYDGVGRIYPGGPKTGRNIEFVDPAKYKAPEDALDDVLETLRDEKIPCHDIVVLTPLGDDKSVWKHKMKVGDVELVRRGQIKGSRVFTTTIHSFKGLERAVVVLTELEHISAEEQTSLLFVALSRARNHLIVLGELPERVKPT